MANHVIFQKQQLRTWAERQEGKVCDKFKLIYPSLVEDNVPVLRQNFVIHAQDRMSHQLIAASQSRKVLTSIGAYTAVVENARKSLTHINK